MPYYKIGDLFNIYDEEEGSYWKIHHYTFNSSSSKFIPCDSPDYDIKISKTSSYFEG